MHVDTGFPLFFILAGLLLMGGFVLAIALAAWSKTRIVGVVLLAVLGVGLLGMMVLVPAWSFHSARPAVITERFEQAQFHYGEHHDVLRGMPPAPERIEHQELPGVSGGWSSSTPYVGEHTGPEAPQAHAYGSTTPMYEVRHKRGGLSVLSLIVVLAAVLLIILLSRERSRGLAVGMMAAICLAGVFGGAVLWFYWAAERREAARHVEAQQMTAQQAYSRHMEHRQSGAGPFDPLPPQQGLIPIDQPPPVANVEAPPEVPAPDQTLVSPPVETEVAASESLPGAPPEPVVASTQVETPTNVAETGSTDAVADRQSADVAVRESSGEAEAVAEESIAIAPGEQRVYASGTNGEPADVPDGGTVLLGGIDRARPARIVAAGDTATGPRPAWVDASPKRVGTSAYQKTVQVGPYSTEREIEQQLNYQLMFAVADYSRQLVGDISALGSSYTHRTLYRAGITPAYVRQNFCVDEYTELAEKPYGTMRTAYVLMEFDQEDNRELAARWREVRREQGVLLASSGGLLVLSLLGVVFGYLKLDTLTKGYYSLRLKLAAAVVILGIICLGALLFDSIT